MLDGFWLDSLEAASARAEQENKLLLTFLHAPG